MEIQENIINKVALSGLMTYDLASLAPHMEDFVVYDIKDNLFHELILREKDFREFIKTFNWASFAGKQVAITCSTDAIVPTWAYMLLANKLEPYANRVIFGSLEELLALHYREQIAALDMQQFADQRVVIKGCGDIKVPETAFVEFTVRLSKVVKSIMYGEPCSTVPVFKRKAG
ncbi:DUF2480 family protein [Sphingobacteriaceae bacterium WQ 2009]|uniref:DUF2480 family protein n=1 Tax=Rhinopithecimicrobium faecis TaxID=2820698 RepID=A0A8T4H9S3_9SPHI|nr:DUF2480 family protein [Sphingobacteriaceae bacterium WQ 2009]